MNAEQQQIEEQRIAAEVVLKIKEIKAHMPEVYRNILAKAEELGKPAFGMVRRGLRGEVNYFYAFEGGRVVGTPFAGPHEGLMAEVALNMVQFGVRHVVMWGVPNGTD